MENFKVWPETLVKRLTKELAKENNYCLEWNLYAGNQMREDVSQTLRGKSQSNASQRYKAVFVEGSSGRWVCKEQEGLKAKGIEGEKYQLKK